MRESFSPGSGEKVPEGRMRGAGQHLKHYAPNRPSSGAARHLLPARGEKGPATSKLTAYEN